MNETCSVSETTAEPRKTLMYPTGSLEVTLLFLLKETFGYTVLRTLKRSSAHTNTLEVSDRQNGIPFSRFKLIRILLLAVEKKQVVSRRSVSFPSASNPLLSNGVKEPSLW